MREIFKPDRQKQKNLLIIILSFWLAMVFSGSALALNVTVMGADNTVSPVTTASLAGYRWLIEEDKTYHVPLDSATGEVLRDGGGRPLIDPNWRVGPDGVVGGGDDDPNRNTVSVNFHHSYMPIVAKGEEGDVDQPLPPECTGSITDPVPCLDSAKNYFISVLPDDGYSIGGAPIKAGQTDVTVYVNKHPIPTAQITILVHADTAPINNVWDLGEQPLADFSIILEDAGGKYGVSAGIQSLDAFGNPICTSYQYVDTNGDGQHNPGELFVEGPDGPLVDVPGAGCVTGSDGTVTIRNLAPGKYGIMTVPPSAVEDPPDSGNYVSTNWTQTSTIEGKKLIDAWVKANEPAFFGEFGPPGPHVTIGYVPAGRDNPYIDLDVLTGGAMIEGQVVNLHLSAPPDTAFYSGGPFPHTTPWVGLNLGAAGEGKGVYAARANDDGTFVIPDVPPGNYQLAVWDDNMDLLFARSTVIVNSELDADDMPTGVWDGTCNSISSCDLGDVPVFQWFARMEHYVYNDVNENGIWDDGERPIGEQNVNLRWRDGTIYQAFPTDGTGIAPFDEVFPFFSWLVAEVDFAASLKATGAFSVVDDGGPIPFGTPLAYEDNLNPQQQADGLLYRLETGPVLTEAFQGFLGQTSVVEWGKAAYELDQNGGISGMVMYAVTRAEDNPWLAAAEPWEPGIPRVTVNLYDSSMYDSENPGNNMPIATTETDSWDDSLPTGCQTGANRGPYDFFGTETDCFDGMRAWNQVRPGVFDGGYAFGPLIEDCAAADSVFVSEGKCLEYTTEITDPTTGVTERYINKGIYTVEVVPPYGYEVIRSQDRNVDFGDVFFPSPEALPPVCVGDEYQVPTELSLFPGEAAPLAGKWLNHCDRKEVLLSRNNAAADFSLFTEVPIAGHFIGFILDDTANEFDPASPQFGEKYAPPFLPVSIRDWTGREISRTVSDEYGVYNALIPSTFTENLGQPSGISPNMLTTCMNAKSLPDGTPDPLHNPQYSQFCYTFQYMPGSTTYLDTPVVPVAAFAGADQNPLDCAYVDETPRIRSVDVASNSGNTTLNPGGPYIATTRYRGNQVIRQNQTITIESMGLQLVPNPAYGGVGSTVPKLIERDYGFGDAQGTLNLEDVDLTITSWDNDIIVATMTHRDQLDQDEGGGRQLTVTRFGGKSTITGITVQVGVRTNNTRPSNQARVISVPADFPTIQEAIDSPGRRNLILVAPGTYNEMVIMWKPVQLQGWGEGSVTIDAIKTPFEKLAEWRRKVEQLDNGNLITRAPGQELGFGGIEPETFFSEEGAGVFVLAHATNNQRAFGRGRNRNARIDGFTITGADTGGGVVLNAYADYMEVSNNRIVNNSAFFAGGVRVGHANLTVEVGRNRNARIVHSDADNDFVRIHNNTITQNGGLTGAGGGLGLHTGSDDYEVTDNFVCGNFTTAGGAGIAHYGLSDNGLIKDNTIIFNENFNQGVSVNGGGILVAGLPPFGCPFDANGIQDPACLNDPNQILSPGSGSVEINSNRIQGNSAGSGDGAGIRLSRVNGEEVDRKAIVINGQKEIVVQAWTIDIINNMIVNNVAALSGGGISLQDALAVNIRHNTIANNDITSTAGEAFTPGLPDKSDAQPGAGVISRAYSTELANHLVREGEAADFTASSLVNNIIRHNRQFFWVSDTREDPDNPAAPPVNGLCPDLSDTFPTLPDGCGDIPVYDDLAGIASDPLDNNLLTTLNPDISDPNFVREYFNGGRNTTSVILEGTLSMQAPPAFDEGGNFIRLRYGPLTQIDTDTGLLRGDYHIEALSSAIDAAGNNPAGPLGLDIDGDLRPNGGNNDIGADEVP